MSELNRLENLENFHPTGSDKKRDNGDSDDDDDDDQDLEISQTEQLKKWKARENILYYQGLVQKMRDTSVLYSSEMSPMILMTDAENGAVPEPFLKKAYNRQFLSELKRFIEDKLKETIQISQKNLSKIDSEQKQQQALPLSSKTEKTTKLQYGLHTSSSSRFTHDYFFKPWLEVVDRLHVSKSPTTTITENPHFIKFKKISFDQTVKNNSSKTVNLQIQNETSVRNYTSRENLSIDENELKILTKRRYRNEKHYVCYYLNSDDEDEDDNDDNKDQENKKSDRSQTLQRKIQRPKLKPKPQSKHKPYLSSSLETDVDPDRLPWHLNRFADDAHVIALNKKNPVKPVLSYVVCTEKICNEIPSETCPILRTITREHVEDRISMKQIRCHAYSLDLYKRQELSHCPSSDSVLPGLHLWPVLKNAGISWSRKQSKFGGNIPLTVHEVLSVRKNDFRKTLSHLLVLGQPSRPHRSSYQSLFSERQDDDGDNFVPLNDLFVLDLRLKTARGEWPSLWDRLHFHTAAEKFLRPYDGRGATNTTAYYLKFVPRELWPSSIPQLENQFLIAMLIPKPETSTGGWETKYVFSCCLHENLISFPPPHDYSPCRNAKPHPGLRETHWKDIFDNFFCTRDNNNKNVSTNLSSHFPVLTTLSPFLQFKSSFQSDLAKTEKFEQILKEAKKRQQGETEDELRDHRNVARSRIRFVESFATEKSGNESSDVFKKKHSLPALYFCSSAKKSGESKNTSPFPCSSSSFRPSSSSSSVLSTNRSLSLSILNDEREFDTVDTKNSSKMPLRGLKSFFKSKLKHVTFR